MPRVVDETKTEAILDAALKLFSEKGPSVSLDQIAKEAGVSRQTLYNRFPSRVEVGRALAARRSDVLGSFLRTDGDPRTVLTAFASSLLEKACGDTPRRTLRGLFLISPHAPDLAAAIYEAGPWEALRRLADWLAEQDRKGLLSVPDPMAAAEMFAGMALGHSHLRGALGVPNPPMKYETRAREAAERFIRAFAP